VLEVFGLVVHLVPGVAQRLHQKRFNQAVAADHRHRVRAASVGQLDGAVGLVLHQALLAEFAHPVGDGGFAQSKVLGH